MGPLAESDGNVDVLIRDLDQTVIGNPAHDLIRLGLSLATLARSSALPGFATARILEAKRGPTIFLPTSRLSCGRALTLTKLGMLALSAIAYAADHPRRALAFCRPLRQPRRPQPAQER